MPRKKIVNGVEVQLTPGEEKARDIEEAQAKLYLDEYLKAKNKKTILRLRLQLKKSLERLKLMVI